jgi:hypothetical protein
MLCSFWARVQVDPRVEVDDRLAGDLRRLRGLGGRAERAVQLDGRHRGSIDT